MAQIRQPASTSIADAGAFAIPQMGMDKVMQSQAWTSAADTATTVFDLVSRQHDQDAVRQAQIDAPAMVTRNGTGMIVPPQFDPPGLTSRAYRDAYRQQTFATYSNSVESDHTAFLGTVQAKYPTDLAGAQTAMDERTRATVSGLAPEYAPLVTLRLNSLNGQVASRINANVIGEQQKVSEQNATTDVERVIESASRFASLPAKFDKDTLAVNSAMAAQQFDQANKSMIAAGYSQARIDKVWQDARTKTQFASDVNYVKTEFKTVKAVGGFASPEDAKQFQLDILEEMDKRSEHLPQSEKVAQRAIVRQAIAEESSRMDTRVAIADARAQTADAQKNLDIRRNMAAAGTDPDVPGVTAQGVLQSYARERNGVFTDSSLSTAQKVRRLGIYDSAMGTEKATLAEYASAQINSLYIQATNPDTPMERAKSMRSEIVAMATDPNLTASLPPAVRNRAEYAASQIATNAAKMDMQGGVSAGTSGTVSPADRQKMQQQWTDKGWIGNGPNALMSHAAAAQWADGADRAYAARQLTAAEARAAVNDFNSGSIPSSIRQAAMKASMPAFSTPDGSPLDLANPAHQTAAASYTALNAGTIPEAVVAELKATPFGNPDKARGAAETYQQLRQVYASHGFNQERSTAILNTQLGADVGSFMQNVLRWGAEQAAKIQLGNPNSVSQQAGQSVAAATTDVDKAVDTTLAKLGRAGDVSMWQQIRGTQTEAQKAMNRTLGDSRPSVLDRILPFNATEHGGTYATIAMSPAMRAQVTETATQIMKRDGKSLTAANPGVDANHLAVLQAMEVHRGDTELVADPNDSTKATIDFKSGDKRLGEAFDRPGKISPQENNGYSLGLWNAEQQERRRRGMPDVLLAPYDPKTVRIDRFQNPDGTATWIMAAQPLSGLLPVELMRMNDGDPRLSAYIGDIKKATDVDLRNHWFGKTPGPDTRSQAFVAGSVAGRAFGQALSGVGKSVSALFEPMVRESDRETRLLDPTHNPQEGHYTKRMFDGIFGTNFADSPRPMIDMNPLHWIMPSMVPQENADWAQIRKSMEDKGSADLKGRSQNVEMLNQLLRPKNYSPIPQAPDAR